MPEQKFKTKASLLLYFLKGAKRWFALAVFFAAMVSVTDLINPKIIGYTIDTILNGLPARLSS